jgi:hypothetical protein
MFVIAVFQNEWFKVFQHIGREPSGMTDADGQTLWLSWGAGQWILWFLMLAIWLALYFAWIHGTFAWFKAQFGLKGWKKGWSKFALITMFFATLFITFDEVYQSAEKHQEVQMGLGISDFALFWYKTSWYFWVASIPLSLWGNLIAIMFAATGRSIWGAEADNKQFVVQGGVFTINNR